MTAAFPLAWPEGWPRTVYHRRETPRFRADFVKVRYDLLNELRLLGATNVVVSSNVPLRNDGLPYADAAKKRLDDPGIAIYFMLKKRQMTMARDIWLTPADNMRTVSLAVKYLRGLERHGGSYMMERAFQGFAALPSPGSIDWPSILQVPREAATRDKIEAAFRRLAAERHPDRGGSDVLMAELNEARARALKDVAA